MLQLPFPELPHCLCSASPCTHSSSPSPRAFFLNSCPFLRSSIAASVWIDFLQAPSPWGHPCLFLRHPFLTWDRMCVYPRLIQFCALLSCHSFVNSLHPGFAFLILEALSASFQPTLFKPHTSWDPQWNPADHF